MFVPVSVVIRSTSHRMTVLRVQGTKPGQNNAEKAAVNYLVDCFFFHENVISYIVAEVYAAIRDP